ncbi:MAG: tetratricopeptide repeat protein [Tannerella sp.]|nr:tetratricopeptide repeat protein [Tannerella sp.]
MTEKEIYALHAQIIQALDEGALKAAFELIQTLISGAQAYDFQHELSRLQETYRYLLHYYVEGNEDPTRAEIYVDIRTGAWELADRITHFILTPFAQHIYYVNRRTISLHLLEPDDFIRLLPVQYEAEDRKPFDDTLHQLFLKLWTTPFLSDAHMLTIRKALTDQTFPLPAKCQIISAILLGLQMSFDAKKISLLFDAAADREMEIRVRALTGICLTLSIYRQRTDYYPAIRHRLETLADEFDLGRMLQTIILRFILARETEKVTHKLHDILPEMTKFVSKSNLTDMLSELAGEGVNPEWQDEQIYKKMEEYSNLLDEGLDVMHSTFIHLKYFPFFHQISNWFLPYSADYSAFADRPDAGDTALKSLMRFPFLCNSDKYSFIFCLFNFPEKQREDVIGQLREANSMNELHTQEWQNKIDLAESITGQYVQDLYRFYKLHPHRAEFKDIFSRTTLDFHRIPLLQPYFSDTEILPNIAGLYLRKEYYEDALTIYAQLLEGQSDEMLYQKAGYCKQMTGDLQGALTAYLRSELLNPDSKWLVRRIADCYRSLKQPEEAIKFYLRYEQISPDSIPALLCIGHCYLELKNYDDALKYYFKASYLEPKNPRVQRAVAWCSFLAGKYEQARNYYRKILDGQPQEQDYLNAGHTEWALRNISAALTFYASAIFASGGWKKFLTLFNQDISDLTHAGIKDVEIRWMLDCLHDRK